MKKIAVIFLVLALILCIGSTAAEESGSGILGKPFPDFTVTDTEGNTFTLSEALNGHEAVLNSFLGDGYEESKVLTEIPADTSTRALPVSAKSAIYPLDSKYRKVLFYIDGLAEPQAGYIVPAVSVTMRIDVGAGNNIANTVYIDEIIQAHLAVESLYDPEKGIFVHDQGMQSSFSERHYVEVFLYDETPGADLTNNVHVYLLPGEENADEVVESMKQAGVNAHWEYADEAAQQAEGPEAYIIHVVDQDNNPVEEVVVNFCTDSACTPKETDETGTITFKSEPYKYHLQIVEVPDGYSWDEGFDMYTTKEYGEWVLRIKKEG